MGLPSSRAIIFEDSKSGLLSAVAVSPRCVVGIESMYDNKTLMDCGANMTCTNYLNLSPNIFLGIHEAELGLETTNVSEISMDDEEKYAKIKSWIFRCVGDVENVSVHREKLKGGFIADVYAVDITSKNDVGYQSCVAKLKSTKKTFLSEMSERLKLNEREMMFYDTLCHEVPMKTPLYIGLIQDEECKPMGVLLENLYHRSDGGQFELNLSQSSQEIIESIIDAMLQMHNYFWGRRLRENYSWLEYPRDFRHMSFFVKQQFPAFEKRWQSTLSTEQMEMIRYGVDDFEDVQTRLSDGDLTLCHGDIKSGNIFFHGPQHIPIFCDWQYVGMGKGVQDLVFFLIESFDSSYMTQHQQEWIQYYYIDLDREGYSWTEYYQDIKDAVCYFPLFVALWFGTLSEDELIDKTFPYTFIQRWVSFIGNLQDREPTKGTYGSL